MVSVGTNGKASQDEGSHTVTLTENLTKGKASICTGSKCSGTALPGHPFPDRMQVSANEKGHVVEKRFTVDGRPARVYDPVSKKSFDYVRVDASMKDGFIYTFHNN